MGQTNLPMLNRAGETIFWNSINENLISFLKCFCESYFFQKILLVTISNRILNSIIFFNKNNIFKNYWQPESDNEHDVFISTVSPSFEYNRLWKFAITEKNIKQFLTKTYFMSYSNWIVVTIRMYICKYTPNWGKQLKLDFLYLWKYLFFINLKTFKKDFVENNYNF